MRDLDRWTRRGLLWLLGGAALEACRRDAGPAPAAPPPTSRFEGFAIGRVDSFLTPTADFFVRDHFGVPAATSAGGATWTVSIEGDLAHPFALSLSELAGLAPVERPVTLECAGNGGRNGVGWPGGGRAFSGVSTARFQGVSLAALLKRAGVGSGVREVVFEGADVGVEAGATAAAPFARSVPLEVALSGDALLAVGMNGAPLPARHGGPVRVIFPGRYATDSVKWVRTIRAVSVPFAGFYQASRYRRASAEQPAGVPLGALKVQSEIARPRLGDRLPQGMQVDVIGVAWGGEGGVDRVEVSVDGGSSFARATFIDEERPHCWRRWKLSWTPDAAGPRLLMARATDRQGTAQPLSSDEELGTSYSLSGPDRIQYANNAVPVVSVTVT